MMTGPSDLTWQDFLELSATLAALTGVRRRFLPLDLPKPAAHDPRAMSNDGVLLERTVAIGRAGLYNFLATTFSEPPSASFVASLCESGALDLLAAKGLGGDDLARWKAQADPAARATELATEYTVLFTRPGPRRVPAVASDYLDLEGDREETLSPGRAAEAVVEAYREAGVVVGVGPYAADHLGIELQFMQHCAAREAAAWGEGNPRSAADWRKRQSAFLQSHLLPWVNAFAERVGRAGTHAYYRSMASLVTAYVRVDAKGLAESPEGGVDLTLSSKASRRNPRGRLHLFAG